MKDLPITDSYEALTETLEIMADEHLMASLHQSIREAKAGKLVSWERAKRKLKL